MAGDRKVYDKTIKDGLNHAWEGDWAKALDSYQRALAELPDDPTVHGYVGLAYFELGRLGLALEAYSNASRLAPDDPDALARVAEIHERLGQRHAAADALFSMAEIHQRHRDWSQAIQALQRVTQLCPDHLQAREALADIYAELDRPQRAVKEHLQLAQAFQRQGQVEKALAQCRRALEIDPRNSDARTLVKALRRGEPTAEVKAGPLPFGEGAGPVDAARDKALEELAGIPFEDSALTVAPEPEPLTPEGLPNAPAHSRPSRAQIDGLVAKAIDYQTRGLIEEAIACHVQLIEAGLNRPAAHFNLGFLYKQRLQFEPAVAEFKRSMQSPEYRLVSHFALGECFRALGAMELALEHLVQVLKIVELDAVDGAQADELIQLYDALMDSYSACGNSEQALAFANSLLEFLSSPGWENKVCEARQRLDAISAEGMTMSLAEFLAVPSADSILASMSLSHEYVEQGAFTAAVEVCYGAIEAAPTYLPLHLRLAEIFALNDRIEDAAAKYQAVADLYLVRAEVGQAIGVYRRILDLKPMDVVSRSQMIDLLIGCGEIDQALEQYITLAGIYYDLAQVNKALENCGEALRLVPRASDRAEWHVRLLHTMMDMHLARANWREAVELCQQMVSVAPDDERARLSLIDLNYKLGRAKEADKGTVAMLEYYRSQERSEKALALLQELVRLQPRQMPLRARLARAYVDADMREEAVRELDALGELQLDAGLRQQAIATVRHIISLNPKNVRAYRQLLAQL